MPASAVGHVGVNLDRIDTTQQHELGIIVNCNDGTRRRYVRAGAAVAQYDALQCDFAEGHYDFQPTSAALQPIVGVCPVLGVADNNFFWAIIEGKATVKVAAAVTAGAHLATTAVAGTLDDVAAAAADAQAAAAGIGCEVVVDDVPSAGLATVILN